MNHHRDISERLDKKIAELKQLYLGLYHGDEKSFNDYLTVLREAWERRGEELKKQDREREEHPDWYRETRFTGMQLYVDAFAGTLKGVEEKLDYLEECGINFLHLLPVMASPKGKSDGGYAVSDYGTVRPELGTTGDLAHLTQACRERGIAVCLDFVLNHTSDEHEWARRARAGEKRYQSRYFFFDDWTLPNAFEQTVPQVFPETAPGNFTWCEEAGKVVMTSFWPYQWDLNYSNPEVFNSMTGFMLNLCNLGADVVRLDAVPYIWKALGTSCRDLPQVHILVRMLRLSCEIVCPGTLLLGEVILPPEKIIPYFGTTEKPECHLLYNAGTMASLWHTVATRDVRLLDHQLEPVLCKRDSGLFLNYIRCHDDITWDLDYDFLRGFCQEEMPHRRYLNDYFTGRWKDSPARGLFYNGGGREEDVRICGTTASLCGVESARERKNRDGLEKATGLDIMLHAFLLTLKGVPVISGGDEIARENDYSYREDPEKQGDSRFVQRGRMDWKKAGLRKLKNTTEGQVFSALTELEKIRNSHFAFHSEADCWGLQAWNDHVLGIGRYYRGEKLLALFNFDAEEQSCWLNDNEIYTDLMTGERMNAHQVKVAGNGFRWLSRFE